MKPTATRANSNATRLVDATAAGLAGLDALYLSFAEVTNATFGRQVVETGAAVLKP